MDYSAEFRELHMAHFLSIIETATRLREISMEVILEEC